MKKNRKQKSKNKKLEERIENLRQQGFYFPPNIQSPNKKTPEKQTRFIRRIADWWETTPIEKFLEDIEYLLRNSATLEIIGLLANAALIVSLVTWLTEFEERKEAKLFSTWTIINDGKGDKSGVVKTAVERLYKNGFSLSGLQLNKTNLSEANLGGANLGRANLSQADLILANLSQANFSEANLSQADLTFANLSQADLILANLSEANLSQADLIGAKLSEVNLIGANLFGAKNLSNLQIKLACNWKEAIYVDSKRVDNKFIPIDKQANQERIKEIEQDKNSDLENPPDCSIWD
ncbi:MAG: pentapeptide repeat-containing protein [Okeania sp. SIO3B3]|nr:pentapeptide repeat-containing protein [Okeania sp. SIO3B3]